MCLFMVSSSVAQKEPERRSETEKQTERRLKKEKKKTERDKRDGESKRHVTSFCRLGESGSVDS